MSCHLILGGWRAPADERSPSQVLGIAPRGRFLKGKNRVGIVVITNRGLVKIKHQEKDD